MGMTVRYEVPTTRIYRKMDVILNKVNGELYSLDGIPDPVAVVSVIASGLPYAKDVDEMTWRGDFARFIMDHLKIVRYPK
jgi:hypothetical protein